MNLYLWAILHALTVLKSKLPILEKKIKQAKADGPTKEIEGSFFGPLSIHEAIGWLPERGEGGDCPLILHACIHTSA